MDKLLSQPVGPVAHGLPAAQDGSEGGPTQTHELSYSIPKILHGLDFSSSAT